MVNLILVNISKLHGTYIKFQPQQLLEYSAQIQLSVCKSLQSKDCEYHKMYAWEWCIIN